MNAEHTNELLEALEAKKSELRAIEEAIEAQRQQWFDELVESVAEDVYAQGHDSQAFLKALTKRLGVRSDKPVKGKRKQYRFANGLVYHGGRVPGWLREAMDDADIDNLREYLDQYAEVVW